MDLSIEINRGKNDQEYIQNVDIPTIKMVSITIENVKNIKDKEDEIS
tara:strand:+ start:259 stop:399 length:141 start_codon:yes stop_codon:yes gene_type:complete